MSTGIFRISPVSNTMSIRLLYLNIILMAVGSCGAPLIIHLYFIYGGKRVWLSTWLQTAGFPIILIPLLISFLRRQMKADESKTAKPILMNIPLFIASAFLGLVFELTNYTFSFGMGHLPATTALLIISLLLAFLSVFAFIVVQQKFTCYSFIAVVLLVAGAACLSAVTGSDKLPGESNKLYYLGFGLTIVYAALAGLLYPLIEWAYKNGRQEITYTVVMQSQVVMGFIATLVSTIAMLIENDFKAIPVEAAEFQLGEAKYYVVLVSVSILSLFVLVGATGLIFSESSLLAGNIFGLSVPISEVLALSYFPHEKFGLGKGISLVLCFLGFLSYCYSEIKQRKESNRVNDEASEMFLEEHLY